MYDEYSRRDFIRMGSCTLGCGLLASCTSTGKAPLGPADARPPIRYDFDKLFPRYTEFDPIVPVWCVTPGLDRVIHRFHSTSPFSPSGRYLALTRLAREDRPPEPGEVAEVILVDLHTGKAKVVSETRGWDAQLGAQAQWGADDTQLFFNDMDTTTWMPFGVKMNPTTGDKKKLDGTVYTVSPNGRWAASACLRRIGQTQAGYGVVVPPAGVPVNKGAPNDDGVFVTDTETGKTRMIASYKRMVEEAVPRIDVSRYGPGDFYGFHVKWNSKNDRIMLVLRYLPKDGSGPKPSLVTMTADGQDIRVAIPDTEWVGKNGVHPAWCPDGEHLLMNLDFPGKGLRIVQVRYDGSDFRIMTDVLSTRGHATLHPGGKFILTDEYPTEAGALLDGTARLFLIDVKAATRKVLARMDSVTRYFKTHMRDAGVLRVDLHPAWDRRTYTHCAFNGVMDGTRKVFVADLSALVHRA